MRHADPLMSPFINLPSIQPTRQALAMCLLVGLLSGLLLLVFATDAQLAPPSGPDEVLQRIASAEREVSYVGKRISMGHAFDNNDFREEFVVHKPPTIHFVKVVAPFGDHRSPRGRGEEKDGNRENQRGERGKQRNNSGDSPRNRGTSGGRRPPPPERMFRIDRLSSQELELLEKNYTLQLESADSIAGHETYSVSISSRFEGRPTKRLVIAKENGIVLRTEDLDSEGNLRFLSVYTQISFDPEHVEQKLTELQLNGTAPPRGRRSQKISIAEAQEILKNRLVQPTYLPPGFQLLETRFIKNRSETVYLRYTDGLLTFTVFETKGKPRRNPSDRNHGRQTVHLQDTVIQVQERGTAHILQWYANDVSFTLIGEFDQREILKVAESLILTAKK